MLKESPYQTKFSSGNRAKFLSRSIEVRDIDLPPLDDHGRTHQMILETNVDSILDARDADRLKLEDVQQLAAEYCQSTATDNFQLKLEAQKLMEHLSIKEVRKLSKEIEKFDHLEPLQLDAFHRINKKTKWESTKDERQNIFDYRESKKDQCLQKMMAKPNKRLRELMREVLLRSKRGKAAGM